MSHEPIMKRFTLPANQGLNCSQVVMRELTGIDDLEIGLWVDARANATDRANMAKMLELERRESTRRALVMVDGVLVNEHGAPFLGMDNYNHRTMRYLYEFFSELNGVEQRELKKAVAESVVVDLQSLRSGGTTLAASPRTKEPSGG